MKWYVSPGLAAQEKERLVNVLDRMAKIASSPYYYPFREAEARSKLAGIRGDTEEEHKQGVKAKRLKRQHEQWLLDHHPELIKTNN